MTSRTSRLHRPDRTPRARRAWPRGWLAAAALLAACVAWPRPGLAQPEDDDTVKRPPKPVLRTYDVRPLLNTMRDYPYWSIIQPPTWEAESFDGAFYKEDSTDGDWYEMPRGSAPVQASTQEQLNLLVTLVTETIDPTSWRRAGGELGSIRVLHGVLIVHQTPENHVKIAKLLALLHPRMVSLKARWVSMDAAAMDKLLADAGAKTAPIRVSYKALEAAGAKTLYQGVTTGFNGQLVHLVKGRGISYVANVEPVVAENAAALRPVIGYLLWGTVLEARVALTNDGEAMSMSVRSAMSEADPKRPAGTPAAPGKEKALAQLSPVGMLSGLRLIEKPGFYVQSLRASLEAPLNTPVLVGAMTRADSDSDDPARADKARGQVVLLVVEASAAPKRPVAMGRGAKASARKPPPAKKRRRP